MHFPIGIHKVIIGLAGWGKVHFEAIIHTHKVLTVIVILFSLAINILLISFLWEIDLIIVVSNNWQSLWQSSGILGPMGE